MNQLWNDLLSHKNQLIGGQMELRSGMAVNRGKIIRVNPDTPAGLVRFYFSWLAHDYGPDNSPRWRALAAGFEYSIQLTWEIRMIDVHEFHFNIPNDGSGIIYLAKSDRLIKEHEVTDIAQVMTA